MHLDPIVPALYLIVAVVLVLAITLRRLHQPHLVAYVLAGILLGPSGLGLVTDLESMSRLGSIGIVLLLFFVGMEVNLPRLVASWRIAAGGTILQILGSLAVVWFLGRLLHWPVNRIVMLGFVISLSSTAVVFKILQERTETDSRVGQSVTGVLLVQDLVIVPMLIVLAVLSGSDTSGFQVGVQVVVAAALVALTIWVLRRGHFPLPFMSIVGTDPELRLLLALLACFSLALATGLAGLSSALGAFIAGVLITYSKQGAWIHDRLGAFRDLLVGAFFFSIGMMIDLDYALEEWLSLTGLVVAVLVTNTLINAVIIRLLGESWSSAWYAGALLAQIGELSFLLVAVGLRGGVISEFAYQATVATIAVTLAVSPMWIAAFRRFTVNGGDDGAATASGDADAGPAS